jgi:hypothetical protein
MSGCKNIAGRLSCAPRVNAQRGQKLASFLTAEDAKESQGAQRLFVRS